MEQDRVTKQTDNRFLNMYHIDAHKRNGEPFDYYFASRNDYDSIKYLTHSELPEGMAIMAICAEQHDHMILLKQYRYPIGDYMYELPAGLIESGENAGEAAIREMQEETGLTLSVYEGGKEYYHRPAFLAQGMTDESGEMVYGYASGTITNEFQEQTERIETVIADKDMVRRILASERVSVRAMFAMMLFLNSDENNPFSFLDK